MQEAGGDEGAGGVRQEAEEGWRKRRGVPAITQAARAARRDVQRTGALAAPRLPHCAAASGHAVAQHPAAQVPQDRVALPQQQDAHVRPPESGQGHHLVRIYLLVTNICFANMFSYFVELTPTKLNLLITIVIDSNKTLSSLNAIYMLLEIDH